MKISHSRYSYISSRNSKKDVSTCDTSKNDMKVTAIERAEQDAANFRKITRHLKLLQFKYGVPPPKKLDDMKLDTSIIFEEFKDIWDNVISICCGTRKDKNKKISFSSSMCERNNDTQIVKANLSSNQNISQNQYACCFPKVLTSY